MFLLKQHVLSSYRKPAGIACMVQGQAAVSYKMLQIQTLSCLTCTSLLLDQLTIRTALLLCNTSCRCKGSHSHLEVLLTRTSSCSASARSRPCTSLSTCFD